MEQKGFKTNSTILSTAKAFAFCFLKDIPTIVVNPEKQIYHSGKLLAMLQKLNYMGKDTVEYAFRYYKMLKIDTNIRGCLPDKYDFYFRRCTFYY